ncbi:CGNR zinc finger domain-containing protein [soil metagenome]
MLWTSTGDTLQDPSGTTFWYDPGAACLDLAYTGGDGPLAKFERLTDAASWVAWFAQPARSIPLDSSPGPASIGRARRLREVIRSIAAALADGTCPEPALIAELNAAAARPALSAALASVQGSLQRTFTGPITLDRASASLASDAVELFAHTPAGRIRTCSADGCPLVFVDTSRPGTRRWCAMERCGNRAKVRQFRRRPAEA